MSKMKRIQPKIDTPAHAFLIDFLRFCDRDLFKGAPTDMRRLIAGGLREPKGEDDPMYVALKILATRLPKELLSRDLMDPKRRNHPTTMKRRGALAAVVMHPGWQRLHMLKQLIDRVEVFKAEKPKDWQHWLYVTFDLMNLVVQRNLADVQQLLKEEHIEVDLEPTIADNDTLLKKATEVYRDRLYEWKNENDRPPFTKQDMWIALLQDKEQEEGVLMSVSELVEVRARRIMENYGLCLRDSRIVVATMEQLGNVINLANDDTNAVDEKDDASKSTARESRHEDSVI